MAQAEITPDFIVKSRLPALIYPNIPFAEYLANSVSQQNPHSIAVIDPNTDEQLTFAQLHEKSQFFANGLLQTGVTQDDLILLYSDNSCQLILAFFGAIYLGVTISPVKPAHGAFELTGQILHSNGTILVIGQAKLETLYQLITNSAYATAFEQIKTIIVLDAIEFDSRIIEHKRLITFNQLLDSNKLLNQIPFYKPQSLTEDILLLVYTSGTTGKPKGAIHTNRSFLATYVNVKAPEEVPGKVALIWNPIGHISGCGYIPMALTCGMTVIVYATTDLESMLRSVERFKVNHLFITANHANLLATVDYQKQFNLSSLEIIKFGGSRIASKLLMTIKEKYNVWMMEYYGSTEFYGHVMTRTKGEMFDHFEPGNLGTVRPNVNMKIVDIEGDQTLSPGVSGEIYFRGAPRFLRYHKDEVSTSEAIDADGWLHTGDIGYYNTNGCLFLTDRYKEMIKYKIWSVYPAEIESFLQQHDAVEAVCVVGVAHATDGHLPRAYVQVVKGKKVTAEELMDYVKENMGFQNRLRGGVRFISEIPRSVIGKVERKYFKQLVNDDVILANVE